MNLKKVNFLIQIKGDPKKILKFKKIKFYIKFSYLKLNPNYKHCDIVFFAGSYSYFIILNKSDS